MHLKFFLGEFFLLSQPFLLSLSRRSYLTPPRLLVSSPDQPPSNIIFAAESLRDAANEIGKVSGMSVKVDDVLDRLFGEFCIGEFFWLFPELESCFRRASSVSEDLLGG